MRSRKLFRFGLYPGLVLAWFGATTASAAESVPTPVAPAQSTGSYSVSYPPCSTCVWHGLYEAQGGSSSWTYVGTGSVSFSNRPDGTYRYRVHYGFFTQRMYLVQPGPEISVVVSRAPIATPDIALQLQFSFETRGGDIDGDGRRDMLLRRVGGPASPVDGTVGAVLLRQTGAGILTPTVPTEAQVATAAGWPLLTTRAAVRDVNIDGYADVVLTGISQQYGLGSVRDQIVLAHGQIGSGMSPTVVDIDSNLAKFARDISPHLLDPEYFPTHVPVEYAVFTYYDYSWCQSGYPYWGDQSYILSCYPTAYYFYVAYRDFSAFHPQAVYIAGRDYSVIHGFETAESAFDQIEITLESVLETSIGGWDAQAVFGGAVNDPTARRGMELFSVLGAIVDAAADENDSPGAVGSSNADRVLLTGRRVLGYGPFHTALQYGTTTISAHDDDPRALFDGTLVSQIDWPPDRPHLTMVLGAVDGPAVPATYWATLLGADSNYGDDLRYDTFPSLGAGGHNSNGFVSGIVQATAGLPTVPMTRFVGGEKPVPAYEFH